MKDEEAKRELEKAKRDLQGKINVIKSDVRNMGVRYEKEKVGMERRWQEMVDLSQRERDKAEKRRVAAEQQAQTDRDNQKRQYDSSMDQMKTDTGAKEFFLYKNYTRTYWTATPKVKLPLTFGVGIRIRQWARTNDWQLFLVRRI
jgi:hypothetical protein